MRSPPARRATFCSAKRSSAARRRSIIRAASIVERFARVRRSERRPSPRQQQHERQPVGLERDPAQHQVQVRPARADVVRPLPGVRAVSGSLSGGDARHARIVAICDVRRSGIQHASIRRCQALITYIAQSLLASLVRRDANSAMDGEQRHSAIVRDLFRADGRASFLIVSRAVCCANFSSMRRFEKTCWPAALLLIVLGGCADV